MTEFEAISRELERLHEWYGTGDPAFNLEIWKRILTLEDALLSIAAKKNGL